MEANKLYNVLDRYFKRLSQVGYIPDNSTFSILILVYIAKLEKENILTKEQKSIINKAISCLQGNCFIPYNLCKEHCI